MKHVDEALRFDCAGDVLFGLLSRPLQPIEVGVVILIGGPQYRIGGHRQYVLLARALADAGYAVLRFDYRGNGDSGGKRRIYENVSDDIRAAVNTLCERVPTVRKVVLWGLCGGASAALIYWNDTRDRRIGGLCVMNPWIRTEASLARTHLKHYYRQRLLEREFWAKFAHGGVAWTALRGLGHSIRLTWSGAERRGGSQLSFQERMASAWHAYDGRLLLMISGRDYTAKEFLEYVQVERTWKGALDRLGLERRDLPDADHTCSEPPQRAVMQRLIIEWLATLACEARAPTQPTAASSLP